MLGLDLPTAEPLRDLRPAGPAGLVMAVPPAAAAHSLEEMITLRWCHVLAHALRERTGWPVVVVGDGRSGWVHAGVRMPDDRILDVNGSHSPGDWLDEWAVVMDEYRRDYRDQCDGIYDPEAVDIYDWQAVDADTTLLGEKVPSHVRVAAARTSDNLLAGPGWHPAGAWPSRAEPT